MDGWEAEQMNECMSDAGSGGYHVCYQSASGQNKKSLPTLIIRVSLMRRMMDGECLHVLCTDCSAEDRAEN